MPLRLLAPVQWTNAFRDSWLPAVSVRGFAIGACWVGRRQFDDGGVGPDEIVAVAGVHRNRSTAARCGHRSNSRPPGRVDARFATGHAVGSANAACRTREVHGPGRDRLRAARRRRSAGIREALVDVVDRGGLADRADAGYALGLAAEITAGNGGLDAAERLARRAVEAQREYGGPGTGYLEAFHGELLLRLGREDEGMACMLALRPSMVTDADAATYVTESLVEAGYPEVAERWLTNAVEQTLEHPGWVKRNREGSADSEAVEILFSLTQLRHRLRRDLGLPHDTHDDLADQLMDAVDEVLEQELRTPLAVLYWPADEFARLLECWPTLAEIHGGSWDEHRRNVERQLVLEQEAGRARLATCAGTIDDFVEFTGGDEFDPCDDRLHQDYAEHVVAHRPKQVWPPGRNESCWCGSGSKYKKCCRPRSRD